VRRCAFRAVLLPASLLPRRSRAANARAPSALALPPNVTFLGARGTLLLRGTLFVGACAWFDYAFAAPECDPHACQQHFRHVALPQGWFAAIPAPPAPPIDLAVLAAAAADAAHVRAVVAAAQEDPSVERIVVVTHTVPHRQLLRKGLYPKALIEAGYYGCSAMEAVPEADVRRKIALWCFGHSHVGADARLAHIHYLSHPRGRPDDFAREQYAPRGVLLAEHAGPACAEEASAAGTTERAPLAVAANGL